MFVPFRGGRAGDCPRASETPLSSAFENRDGLKSTLPSPASLFLSLSLPDSQVMSANPFARQHAEWERRRRAALENRMIKHWDDVARMFKYIPGRDCLPGGEGEFYAV